MDRQTLLSLLSTAPQEIIDAAATGAFDALRDLPYPDVRAWLHDAPAPPPPPPPPPHAPPRPPKPQPLAQADPGSPPPLPVAICADDLTEQIAKALSAAGSRGIALRDIVRAVGDRVSRVQRALSRMRESGVAVMTGSRRGARWYAHSCAPT